MTCIVGTVGYDGSVYIGADGCASNYHTWSTGHLKVFQAGELLVGCMGNLRVADLVRTALKNEKPREGADLEAYVRDEVVDAIEAALRKGGSLRTEHGVREIPDGSALMVGYRGRLWKIQMDFSVLGAAPWGIALGSGAEPALGSLYTTNKLPATAPLDDPARRCLRALEAAEAVVTTVRGPFEVWRLTKDGKSERLALPPGG